MRTNLRGFFVGLAALLVTPLFAGPGIGPSAVVVAPNTTGPTNADTISFNVRFDLPVNNFNDAADLIITHSGTANTTVTITNISLFQDYTVDIEGITGDGTFTLAVNTGSDVTSLILLPMVSSVTSLPVAIDNTAPVITDPTDNGLYSPLSTIPFSWALPPSDAGSGINNYFIELGSAPTLNDFGSVDVTGQLNYSAGVFAHLDTVYARLGARDNAGNTGFSGSTDGITVDLVFPTIGVPSDIGLFTNSGNVQFSWTTPADADSGINNTFIEVGTAPNANDLATVVVTGTDVYTYTGATHGETLYARVATRDNAGNQTFSGSSDGITVDTVQPSVGTPIDTGATITANAVPFNWTTATDIGSGIASLFLEAGSSLGGNDLGTFDVTGLTNFDVPISASGNVYARLIATDLAGNVRTTISSDGIFATIGDTTPPTVAPVIDEGDFQLSTTFRFFWNNALITDTESGVANVSLRVGTFPGSTDGGIFNVTGLNEYFFAGAANTVYFARLQATDVAGNSAFGGISNGIAADTAPPTGSAPVDAGLYSTSTNVVFNWATPVDNISGVNVVFLQVGLFPGGNTVFNGDVTGLNTQSVTAVEGQTLYARLVMIDGLGNVGFTGSSDGITVDTTGPLALAPTDTDDYELTLATTFNWFTPTDLISGVATTRLQVGTAPGLSDVFNAIVTGNSQTVAISEGQTLYARLVVRDNAGNTTTSGNSDGIVRDTIAPTIIGPFDTGDFTSSPNILFTWTTIEDLVSGLADVQLQVGSAPGASDLFNGPITGNSQAIFGVASGTTAYARIIATDNAGNTRISASTNGITVDNVSPSAIFTNVSDPTFLYHTDFVFLLTASEPLDLLPQDLNLVGDVPGIIQILPTANPYEFNIRVVLNLPTVAGSFAVVLNAGATDIAGNPIIQPAVSDVIPVLVPINSSEENWMMHTY